MKTSADSRKIGMLLKALRDGSLVPRPHFQRRAVWTNKDKIGLINTILDGYPFPEIYVVAGDVDTVSGETKELLVDGQQRIRAIHDFFSSVPPFATNRSIIRYEELNEDQKRAFLNYDVAVRNLGMIEDVEIREVFKRINSTSYNLNNMERYNAVYLGEFKKFSESVSSIISQRFNIFSQNDIRRMRDVSYAASLTAAMMSGYFHRDDEIEFYLESYNELFEEKTAMAARIHNSLDYFVELRIEHPRARYKPDFYNLMVEIDRQLGKERQRPDPGVAGPAIEQLFSQVAAARAAAPEDGPVKRYLDATLANVNDRGNRIARGEVIRDLLLSAPMEPYISPEAAGGTILAGMNAQDDDDIVGSPGAIEDDPRGSTDSA